MCIRDSYKAKINHRLIHKASKQGKLILVTAISPTPAGEGKTCLLYTSPHLGQILGDDQTGHLLLVEGAVVHIAGLHERHEEGAGPGRDLHAGNELAQDSLIACLLYTSRCV